MTTPGYQTPPKCQSTYYSKNPNYAWDECQSKQLFQPFIQEKSSNRPFDPTSNTRIVFISDTHGKHREINLPKGSILIHGGDFTNAGEVETIRDLSLYFKELKESNQFEDIVCIAGNHELTFHEDHYHSRIYNKGDECSIARNALTNCAYLEDETFVTKDLHIYGSPWQPRK